MKIKTLIGVLGMLLPILKASAQANNGSKIEGRVVAATTGEALPNATLQLKKANKHFLTDRDGNFSILLNADDTLIVTHTGYKPQRLAVNGLTPKLLVALAPSNELEEVIVSTGYQTLPKERATGSFEQIDNKLFNQQVSTGTLSRLEAVANSVVVERGTNEGRIMVRGLSTIRGPKDVLVVVDNFPYDGDINNINPNDVESITILKDAAASSIWGAKAGNGVIVITTKKGKYNQPLAIELNSNVTVGGKPDLSYIRQMSSSDFIDVEEMLYSKGYYTSWINSSSHRALSPVVELLNKKAKGLIAEVDADAQINALRSVDVRDQFNKYMYQHPVNQQYALNLQGGTEKISWITAGGLDRNISNLDAGYNRVNLRFQNTYKPISQLQVTSGIYYTQTKTISGKPGYGSVTSYGNSFLPYTQFADGNGNALPVINTYAQYYKDTAGSGRLLDWNYYPLEDYKHAVTTNKVSDIIANIGINYQIFPGLNADVKYQYERQQGTNKNSYDLQSYYARNIINLYSQIASNGTVTYVVPKGSILRLANNLLESNNLRWQLNFDKSWGKHAVTAIAGSELRRMHKTSYSNSYYGYDDNNLTFGYLDYTRQYTNFVTGGSSYITDNTGIDVGTTNYVSTFANAAYTYNGKYTLSASARRDASNLFGLNTNDQWNPFWSSGAAWNVSKEKFYHVPFLSYLRLRATYGFSGNIDPGMVAATTLDYYPNVAFTTGYVYSQISNYYNPELKWETSKMLNTGIDFKASNGRISGSLEYYHKKGENLFGLAVNDYTNGIGGATVKNVAAMNGNGVDIKLQSENIKNSFIDWSTVLNFSFYRDRVTRYYLASLQGSNFIGSGTYIPISGLPGHPVYSIFAYKWAGLNPQNGNPQGYLKGEISEDYTSFYGSGTQISDLKYFGSAIPTVFGNITNTLSYKNISLAFSILYKIGYYFRRESISYGGLFSSWQGHSDYAKRWQTPGDELHTYIPSMEYPLTGYRDVFYAGSEALVEKGDHIRLQFINFNYNIPKHSWPAMALKSLQIYANVSNLGILWKANKAHLDPDYSYGSYSVPNPRMYTLGLRINF